MQRCQYHIVFAPKHRRQKIYGKIKVDIGKVLRRLCEQKEIEIIEAEETIYVSKYAIKFKRRTVYGLFEIKSSIMIFDKYASLKCKYVNCHFWCGDIMQIQQEERKKLYESTLHKEEKANDQITLKVMVE